MDPLHVIDSAKTLSEECLRHIPSVVRFFKASISRSLAMDLHFYVRLQYVALTSFTYFCVPLLFLGHPFSVAPR